MALNQYPIKLNKVIYNAKFLSEDHAAVGLVQVLLILIDCMFVVQLCIQLSGISSALQADFCIYYVKLVSTKVTDIVWTTEKGLSFVELAKLLLKFLMWASRVTAEYYQFFKE